MPKEKLNTDEILRLYEESRTEIIEIYKSHDIVEAQEPLIFFQGLHKLNKSLAVIDTIVKNLLSNYQ